MKILITGATGLVGKAIVALCGERHIAVNYLTTNRQKIVSAPYYQGFYWNPEKGEIDEQSLKGVTAIINLGGATISKRWTKAYKERILSSRVDGIKLLRNTLQRIGPNQISYFVSASAIGIYPDSETNFYDEDETAIASDFLGSVTKAWEEEVNKLNTPNLTIAKIRIGLVLSNKGGALPKLAVPVKSFMGAAFGSGNQWQSWIHIQDLARMFLYVLENNLGGVFNGVGPNPVTNSKLLKELAGTLQRPLLLPNIPKFVMKMALGEMSYLLFASQRVSSKKIQEEGFVFNFQNIRMSLEDLYANKTTKGNAPDSVPDQHI
ncbi:TIGR01777 family oxidoreductase [Spongiimicrobium sp. 3-5]|uniref:TIGR01777 family oxidoreductase n=1 Tax=Spongiimicrobium sp. 3-5 TaxID=3332596 RepID=UPI00397FD97A